MKLSAFELKVSQNPWNSMDQQAHKDFQDARNQSIKNWRNVIYKDIENAQNFSGEADRIPDDYFDYGKIEAEDAEKEAAKEEKAEDYYCNTCGAVSSKDGKCYYCDEVVKGKTEKTKF
jgi:hypothetical protein